MSNVIDIKQRIIKAGYKAVEELIKVAEESIINGEPNSLSPELAADKLKNAAATKKLAIFDAFEILGRIESEEQSLKEDSGEFDKINSTHGFAERNAAKK